jgi:protein phosphatase 1L
VLRAASSAGRRRGPRVLCGGRAADVRVTPRHHGHGWRGFRAVAGRMMLDSSSDPASPAAAAGAGQVQPQRRAAGAVAQAHDGGYASGGWER